MPKGLYLTLGLNTVDPAHYGGWDGALQACENDARDIAALATAAGCKGKTLLTKEATAVAVLGEIQAAARKLAAGDLFVLSYSGHGGQVRDVNGDDREDHLDETWCLHDRMLIDDELYAMWSHFAAGVRIFVLSDSCHSGTVTRMAQYRALNPVLSGVTAGEVRGLPMAVPEGRPKVIPFERGWEVYTRHKDMYDAVQYVAGPQSRAQIGASVLLISGCQDNQLSLDGDHNGLFTGTLKRVWSDGQYKKGYRKFRNDIVALMPPSQTPKFFAVGTRNAAFEAQVPFTV